MEKHNRQLIVSMRGITKRYPGTVALDNVNIEIGKGEIHAILGENGAGKTTLMKILYGMTNLDKGEIHINNQEVKIKSTSDAIKLGIGMVHQHFMLVNDFTIAENVIAGSEPGKGIFLDEKNINATIQEQIDNLKFNLDASKKVKNLSVGEMQRVEILKALYRGANILILDEPTAVLTPQETKELFTMIRGLRDSGKSVILITHKLREILDVSEIITIMRDSKNIDVVYTKDVNEESLAYAMVGREIKLNRYREVEECTEPLMVISDLNYKKDNISILKNINLTLNKGEILGIAGIDGNGQTELIESITGIIKPDTMTLKLDDKKIEGKVTDFIEAGIGHIPEDRNGRGLIENQSINNNIILGYHRRNMFQNKGIFNLRKIHEYSKQNANKFSIKCSNIFQNAKSLSGGNAQKIIIARIFSQNPKVVVAAQPTRGVDIGASEYIHGSMIKLKEEKKGVILISADLNEIKKLSDRIAIIYKGEIVSIEKAGILSDTEIGMLMATGRKGEEKIEG